MKYYTFFIFLFYITFCLISCQASTSRNQLPTLDKKHPLLDKIWSVTEQQFISEDHLHSLISEHDAILLGETHDNKAHHQLQAHVINKLADNHRSPAIAFEMLNQAQQQSIDQFQTSHQGKPMTSIDKTNAFAKSINWEQSGWPEWSFYQPIFHTAIKNDLVIVAANLDIKQIRKLIKQGTKTLDPYYQNLLKKYPYDQALKKELEKEISSAHCELLPEKMLSPMLLGQQTRDLAMSQAMLNQLPAPDTMTPKHRTGVVLIAGSGHTRTDYGIPYYLQQERPELKIISIAFIEVNEEKLTPENYSNAWYGAAKRKQHLPFDYVWFTPMAEREDQCEKMRAHMKKKARLAL